MESQQRQQIKKYLALLLAHWKLMLAFLLVSLTVGLCVYLVMPKVYRAVALLSYERQRITPARMAPEQNDREVLETISTVRDIVLSRKNLESIIKKFNLYPESRTKLALEDATKFMRKQIVISPAQRGDTFTVTFEGRDPEQVMEVTNDISRKFIEENLRYREERATETSKYTQDELNIAKAVLDEKEQTMRDYKLKYYNSMPEQRESNLSRLNALHDQYQAVQDSIQNLERTKAMIQGQINLRRQINNAGAAAASVQSSSTTENQYATGWQRLLQLRRHLISLQGRYTEKHPEVRRTKQLVNQLEDKLGAIPPSRGGKKITAGRRVADPEIGELQIQLKELSLNIQKLRSDQKKLKKEIPQYEQWVSDTPVREAEWNALTRDYNELRRNYDFLVSQNLQASSVENLEKKKKGSKFRVIDWARFPERPYKPNFLILMLAAIGAGLGLAAGMIFAMDFADTSFRDVGDVEKYLGISVVSSIPYLKDHTEVGAERRSIIVWGGVFLTYSIVLLSVLFYLWSQGQIVI
jgi:polysaccharide chain length determinant protein (PEP-CTERM system associated)